MARRGIIPLNPLRMRWHDAMQFMVVICVLGVFGAALVGSSGASADDLLKRAAATPGHYSSIANSSYDSSAIHLQLTSHSNSSDGPVRIVAGNGYYSSHPIASPSSISSRTQVLSKGSQPASLHHSIQSAQGISGSSEYTVSESSYRDGDSAWISSTSLGMRIDETVTEGKVNMGAFQADLSSQDVVGQVAGGKAGKPWKDPALEMEEEYIGTFHISRNMTLNSNYVIQGGEYIWLVYESPYLSFIPSKHISISADEVFNPK